MVFAVILAGGKGSRFWPKSRVQVPKQFLQLNGDTTMLQATVNRVQKVIPLDQIYLVTNKDYEGQIRELLPGLSEKNLFIEPDNKETATCIALAATYLKRLDPQGVMVVLPADHNIADEGKFCEVLKQAIYVAEKTEGLVTLGIQPNRPETGYGYIRYGEREHSFSGNPVYKVDRFTEKPSFDLAKAYLENGNYLWNSGMFIWKISSFFKALKKFLPDLYFYSRLFYTAIGTCREEESLRKMYQEIQGISIDYGMMEPASLDFDTPVFVVKADMGWDDIGSWSALERLKGTDVDGNVIMAPHIGYDSKGCIIIGEQKLIVTLGLRDTIIVETDDVLLVCEKHRDQDIKKIIGMLEERNLFDYL